MGEIKVNVSLPDEEVARIYLRAIKNLIADYVRDTATDSKVFWQKVCDWLDALSGNNGVKIEDLHEMLRPMVEKLAESHKAGDSIVFRYTFADVRIEF